MKMPRRTSSLTRWGCVIDDEVYTLIPVPEGYGIDQVHLAERLKEGGLSSTNDIHYVPLSEDPEAPTKVYVGVSNGKVAAVRNVNQTPEETDQEIQNPLEPQDRARKERIHNLRTERVKQQEEELRKKIGDAVDFPFPDAGMELPPIDIKEPEL
ncbi:MAG: hypothetical protein ACREXP_09535 [Steroidobacteraceae bacterium]